MKQLALVLGLALFLPLVPTPSSGGPIDAYRDLTRAERWLSLRYFWQVPSVYRAAGLARTESAQRYPQLSGSDDARDAYRHAYWNGAMVRRLKSVPAAARWGDAHEDIPNNPAARKAMDLYNNEVGRDVVHDARTRTGPFWARTQYPSDAGVGRLVQEALDRGDLVVIEEVNGRRDPHNGRLVPTP